VLSANHHCAQRKPSGGSAEHALRLGAGETRLSATESRAQQHQQSTSEVKTPTPQRTCKRFADFKLLKPERPSAACKMRPAERAPATKFRLGGGR
jgi:hypothetical protein